MQKPSQIKQELADVKAGIPVRDAEIETLRKENAELREQLEAIGAGGVNGKLMPGAVCLDQVRVVAWRARDGHGLPQTDWIDGDPGEETSAWVGGDIECAYSAPASAQAQPMKVTSHETIDWTEISKRGLLERINREIMHPLGLAVYRCVETGVSGGALVSPDGVWTYEGDSDKAQQVDRSTEMQGMPVDKLLDLQGHASVIFSKAVAWADARVEAALIQEQGKPHGQACDEAAQAHYELVKALRNLQSAQQTVSGADGLGVSVHDALDWYAQQVGNCRRFGPVGDAARADLDADGGRRARAALAQQDADKVDAERYRYLREVNGSPGYDNYSRPEIRLEIESTDKARVAWMKAVENHMGLDAAIDAARKEPGQ